MSAALAVQSSTPESPSASRRRLLYFVTEDYYFVSHRLALGRAAAEAGYDVVLVTRVRRHGELIARAGIRVIPFENDRSSLNPIADVAALLRLVRIYRREQPDVVHHVAMKPVLYGSIAARLAGIRHVVNAVAGMGWLFTSSAGAARMLKPLVRAALGRALRTGVALVQNPEDARLVAEFGVPADAIRTVPGSGVNLQAIRPQPFDSGVPAVLFPARVLWDKGIAEFVEAARRIRADGIEARFVVAGSPDPMNPASVPMSRIDEWVGAGLIEYRGWVDDIATELARCHIVCLPSHREGLPKSLIEASAAGRPIVTTNVPGCRDVVRDGESGLLVASGDATALAEALRRLLVNPQLRVEMGCRGRQRAEQEFGLDAILAQTLALYERPQ